MRRVSQEPLPMAFQPGPSWSGSCRVNTLIMLSAKARARLQNGSHGDSRKGGFLGSPWWNLGCLPPSPLQGRWFGWVQMFPERVGERQAAALESPNVLKKRSISDPYSIGDE